MNSIFMEHILKWNKSKTTKISAKIIFDLIDACGGKSNGVCIW